MEAFVEVVSVLTIDFSVVDVMSLSIERTEPIVETLSTSEGMLERLLTLCDTVDVRVVTTGSSLTMESFLAEGCLTVVASDGPSVSFSLV